MQSCYSAVLLDVWVIVALIRGREAGRGGSGPGIACVPSPSPIPGPHRRPKAAPPSASRRLSSCHRSHRPHRGPTGAGGTGAGGTGGVGGPGVCAAGGLLHVSGEMSRQRAAWKGRVGSRGTVALFGITPSRGVWLVPGTASRGSRLISAAFGRRNPRLEKQG
jgi:hypothetical protein